MTVRVGLGGTGTSNFPLASAFRVWAMSTVFAALSACGPGDSGTEGGASAAPTVVSSRNASENGRPDRVRFEAWGDSEAVTGHPLTPGEKELLARQVSACWTPPVGDAASSESVVRLNLGMNRDGMVQRLEVIDQGKMAESPSLMALVESAIKAVMRCMPLKLPPDKYDQWRVFVLYFDAAPAVQR